MHREVVHPAPSRVDAAGSVTAPRATTLGALEPGALVNLEVDAVAKYVERLLDRAETGRLEPSPAASAAAIAPSTAGAGEVGAIAELEHDSGETMRRDEAGALAARAGLQLITVRELVAWLDAHADAPTRIPTPKEHLA